MPRPILAGKAEHQHKLELSVEKAVNQKLFMDKTTLEKRLRNKRSNEYMESIKKLDVGGCEQSKKQFEACVEAIRNEFKDIPENNLLVGLVAKCYLGQPYDVHTIDMSGGILVHYKTSESMPALIERARSLALHGGYEYIEVYTDCLCAVKSDGSVSIVK
ncbi:hypothetical protein GCM10008905_20460 [Clostridium malenominatum]|uniref:Uncharacterized protein n=1 Tax=Clostridium malenominatum TaxID=1539 RepID=A0ABP3U983_9CLOT